MENCNVNGIYTTDDIRARHRGHWFSEGAMRFFKSRVGIDAYNGPGGIYFVSSEQGPSGVRRYSVRSYDLATDTIDTVGEFNAYTRGVAHRMAGACARNGIAQAVSP